MTNSNNSSITLHVNNKGPFTLHYAIWPFFGLICLIATVWFFVYISTALARRHSVKNEQRNFASLYVTQNSTMGGGGGYEASSIVSPADV
jgi:hypothetical protein